MRPVFCLRLLPLAALVSLSAGLCPPRCVCDDALLVADCTDAELDSFPISLNPRLRSLLLAGNEIRRLDRSMMVSSYKELEYLDLRDNRLESVQLGSFVQQGRLRKLLLGNNQLERLERGTLTGLRQLRVLDLSGNQLQELPAGVLEAVPLLEDLNLADNQLERLSATSVTGAVSLRRLRLAGNRLQRLPAAALKQLPPLETLDISYNQLRRLRGAELARVQGNLAQLNLEGNMLQQLEESNLSGLSQLRRLVLSRTGMVELEGAILSSLTSLEELYLDGNPLTTLRAEPLRQLPQLRLLSVRSCPELSSLHPDTFSYSESLEELVLEDNQQLSTLPSGVFLPPPRLRRLSLRDNALTSLPADAFAWRRLQADLSDNPWRCDCELRWLAELPANASSSGAICATPEPLWGHVVQDLSADQLGCEGQSSGASLALAVILPCVLAALALAVIAVVVWKNRRRLGKRLRALPWRDHLSLQRRKQAPPPGSATYYYRDTYGPGTDGDGRLVPVTEL